jgi:hypothetical protein
VSIGARPDARRCAALGEKRCAVYRFAILLIDDKLSCGLHPFYRIAICTFKEIDMNRFANHALAALAACLLGLSAISATVIAPPAETAAPAAVAPAELA